MDVFKEERFPHDSAFRHMSIVSDTYREIWHGSLQERLFQMLLWLAMCTFSVVWFFYAKHLDNRSFVSWIEPPLAQNKILKFNIRLYSPSSKREREALKQSILNDVKSLPSVIEAPDFAVKTRERPLLLDTQSKHTDLQEISDAENFVKPHTYNSSEHRSLFGNDIFSESKKNRGKVFSSTLRKSIDNTKADRELRRPRKKSEYIEEYVDNLGNEVRRIGNMCSKNNRVMADQMGIDSMYFITLCSTQRNQVEFTFSGKEY